jgi:hypothetical protein
VVDGGNSHMRVLEPFEHSARVGKKRLAGGRERDTVTATLSDDDPRPKRALERRHTLGHRRLRDAQNASGRTQAPGVHQQHKRSQLAQFQIEGPSTLTMRAVRTTCSRSFGHRRLSVRSIGDIAILETSSGSSITAVGEAHTGCHTDS